MTHQKDTPHMTITFKFAIRQRVRIKDVKTVGIVDAVSCEDANHLFRVVFWINGTRFQTWLSDFEIEEA